MKGGVFILDCSVFMSACLRDGDFEYSLKVIASLRSNRAVVPALWPFEVGNVFLNAEKKGRMTVAERIVRLKAIESLSLEIRNPLSAAEMINITSLAHSLNLSFYDASYLQLAIEQNSSLATLDKQLRKSALKAGVSLYLP